MSNWREHWAQQVERMPRIGVPVNAKLSAAGFEPGVLWPLLAWFKPVMRLRCGAIYNYLDVQGFGLGVPPCLRDLTGLPLHPELLIGRATRDRLHSLRPCTRPAGNLWAVDLLTAPQIGQSKEIATLIREYKEARFSTFPGLPDDRKLSLVVP
jgi:hypothetical protein